ncbi:unnamed protein product [Brachionus calyciflorus]|uniref:Transmembrane protein 131 n=1 Tax=Brachionus calyciflorus TaxID=104777 RepID=A0A813M0Z8_9BILA|nr:unnamed protein product [Brachionus calyciflorus]
MTCYDKSEMYYHQIKHFNSSNQSTNSNHLTNYKKYLKFSTRNAYNLGQFSKINFVLSILIYFLITNCISYVQSQESNYYFNDGDAIKAGGEANNNHLENLFNKNFFSVFSNEFTLLNSLESQSLKESTNNLKYSDDDSNQRVEFRPNLLDFKEHQIGVPNVQTVFIINSEKEPLKLESISGSTIHFYCSFFVDKVIPPDGNSSFDVYFLARELGHVKSALYINTNKGIFKYIVKGTGIKNEYKLKPILNARIPINTSFSSIVEFHNPTSVHLQITEIYSSDDDLHLELPNFENTTKSENNKILNSINNKQFWNLEPFETKPIVVVRFMGRNANNHTAFICIKTTQTTNKIPVDKTPVIINKTGQTSEIKTGTYESKKDVSFVLPVELEVAQYSSIFTPYEQIDFGIVTRKSKNSNLGSFLPAFFNSPISNFYISHFYDAIDPNCIERVVDLYFTNSGPNYLTIKNISLVRSNPAVKIYFRSSLVLPPTTQQLTKIGEIRYNPLKSNKPYHNYGKIIVRTNDTNKILQLNYNADLYEGAIEYDKDLTKFSVQEFKNYVKKPNVDEETLRYFDLFNTFDFPIVVYKIELNEIARKFFKILDFNDPVTLYKTSDSNLKTNILNTFRLKFDKKEFLLKQHEQRLSFKKQLPFQLTNFFSKIPKINLFTNLTNFEIPLFIYDGSLVFSKFDTNDEYSQQEFSEFNLDGILLNTVKKTRFQIINYNPINITINSIEISKTFNSTYKDIEINLKLELIQSEPLMSKYDNLRKNDFIKKIYIQKVNQKSIIIVPPHSRVLVDLIVSNNIQKYSHIKNPSSFLTTGIFNYNVKVMTDYEVKDLPIRFKLINGTIELTNKDSSEISKISFKTFPHHIAYYPIHLKSTFAKDLSIQSVIFKEYGDVFKFKWEEYSEDEFKNTSDYMTSYFPSFGLIKANKSILIGHILFDTKYLCKDMCYLGFEPNKNSSLKEISTASISSLKMLQTAPQSLIHDLWLKTFQINKLNFLNSNRLLEALDFDKSLLDIYTRKFQMFDEMKHEFRSSMKILIDKEDDSNLTLNYSFPIEFNLEWPHFLRKNNAQCIRFGSSQILVGASTRNFTLHNPSNTTVLMQIMLLDTYTSKENFLKFLQQNSFANTYENAELNLSLFNSSQQLFSLTLNHKNLHQHKKINKILHDLDIQADKKSIITLLEPQETAILKIKFSPISLGNFDNFLIIRNNLTILDTYHLKADAGTAEIRINNQPPSHTSTFLSNQFKHKTIDEAFLEINMSDKSDVCDSMNRERKNLNLFPINSSLSNILEYLNVLDDNDVNCKQRGDPACHQPKEDDSNMKWYKNREGIVLRDLFKIENIGNTDIFIFKILLDGEPCISQGFEVFNCSPFRVGYESDKKYFLDIRYQPDFTSSFNSKKLTLVTNIGDLNFIIQVKIPYDLLSFCHDSLPRPPLESYLFYLCFGLLSFLITIIFLSSIFESKSLVNFQLTTIKQFKTLNEHKWMNVKEIFNEYNNQKEQIANSIKNTHVISRTKSLNTEIENSQKQPKSPRSTTKEKDNFGFEPLEIDINPKVPSSPRNKERKQQVTRPVTPPSPPVEVNTENFIKKTNDKKKSRVKNSKIDNEKIPKLETVYKIMSSSSSGSISANSNSSSGSSTPSASISPVQFNENISKPVIKQQLIQQEIQKEPIHLSRNTKQKNEKKPPNRINHKILVENTINNALNNIKNNSERTQNSLGKSENLNNNNNNINNVGTVDQNVNFLALLNLLSYQQQNQLPKNQPGTEILQTEDDILSIQLKNLHQLNQQLSQMNLMTNTNIGALDNQETNNMAYLTNDSSYISYDQELANILLNSNLNENLENFSRSVSILSKRSSSSSVSRSSSRVFKPIKTNKNNQSKEDTESISTSFEDEIMIENRSSNTTPTSDFWDVPKSNDDIDDTFIIEDFNPDDEYDNMVKETEKFSSLFHNMDQKFEFTNPEKSFKAKKPLGKAYSTPFNDSKSQNIYLNKNFKLNFDDSIDAHKKFGPIGSNRLLNSNNYSNSTGYLMSNSDLFSDVSNFNEFRLFGDENKSDLNMALDSLIPSSEIWSMTSSNNHLLTNPNQAWNSVLLNDFDSLTSPQNKVNDPVNSDESIKNIWSSDYNNDETK